MPPAAAGRNFALLWTSGALSLLGAHLPLVAYPLVALQITDSAILAGAVGAAALASRTLVRLPAGALVDRWDRKRTLIASDLVRAAAMAAVAVASFTGTLGITLLISASVFDGASSAFRRPAETATLRHILTDGALPGALARNEARSFGAALIGPPAGAALYGMAAALPFLGAAVTGIASTILATRLRLPPSIPARTPRQTLATDILEGLRWTWAQPFLRTTMLAAVGINLVFSGLTLAIILTAQRAGSPPEHIGLALGAASAAGVLGAVAAPGVLNRIPAAVAVLGALWAAALTVALMAVSTSLLPLAILLAAMLLTAPIANTVLGSYQVAVTPPHLQGRVESTMLLIAGAVSPAGPLLVGILVEIWGTAATFAVLAIVAALTASLATAAPTIRQLRPLGEERG